MAQDDNQNDTSGMLIKYYINHIMFDWTKMHLFVRTQENIQCVMGIVHIGLT